MTEREAPGPDARRGGARWAGTLVGAGAFALAGIVPAGAQDAERVAMAQVRLTTDPALVTACTRTGFAHDDSVKDLRRKIVRAGGNTALISFRPDDLSVIVAQIFHCAASPAAPTVPPPPPGPPPPPPPPPPPR